MQVRRCHYLFWFFLFKCLVSPEHSNVALDEKWEMLSQSIIPSYGNQICAMIFSFEAINLSCINSYLWQLRILLDRFPFLTFPWLFLLRFELVNKHVSNWWHTALSYAVKLHVLENYAHLIELHTYAAVLVTIYCIRHMGMTQQDSSMWSAWLCHVWSHILAWQIIY